MTETGPKIITGDCFDVLPSMPENSVDAVVTDPPYFLGFMGKSWDVSGRRDWGKAGWEGRNDIILPRYSGGTIASSTRFHRNWAKAVRRVLKPGGHMVAFCGPRTYHWLAAGVELAGFEIRDCLISLHGTGFPKNLDISKAIDKHLGAKREVIARNPNSRENCSAENSLYEPGTVGKTAWITRPATKEAAKWEGWGTSLKPAADFILLARKPISEGSVAANILKWGTGGLNIDGCRIPTGPVANNRTEQWSGFGQVERPDYEPGVNYKGRWPANVVLDESVARRLDFEAGPRPGGNFPEERGPTNFFGLDCAENTGPYAGPLEEELGGPSRYFFCPRADREEKEAGLEPLTPKQQDPSRKPGKPGGDNPRNRGVHPRLNPHPTVKPVALMAWLIRLITPPGGLVLDPFAGTGTTGIACIKTGFRFIGIEKDLDYAEIARLRIANAINEAPLLYLDAREGAVEVRPVQMTLPNQ